MDTNIQFAEACYDMNSINELEEALEGGADDTDMKIWGINAVEWRKAVKEALEEKRVEEISF